MAEINNFAKDAVQAFASARLTWRTLAWSRVAESWHVRSNLSALQHSGLAARQCDQSHANRLSLRLGSAPRERQAAGTEEAEGGSPSRWDSRARTRRWKDAVCSGRDRNGSSLRNGLEAGVVDDTNFQLPGYYRCGLGIATLS